MPDLIPIRELSDLCYYNDPETVLHGDGQWEEVSGGGMGGTIYHGSNENKARFESETPVIWIGSVEPNNALDGDIWINN